MGVVEIYDASTSYIETGGPLGLAEAASLAFLVSSRSLWDPISKTWMMIKDWQPWLSSDLHKHIHACALILTGTCARAHTWIYTYLSTYSRKVGYYIALWGVITNPYRFRWCRFLKKCFFLSFLLVYGCLPGWVYVHMCVGDMEARRIRSLWAGVTGRYELPWGTGEWIWILRRSCTHS